MTVREGGPPGGLLRWLLFDDINHPRYAKFIGDFAKAMRPESFLPGHFDFSVSGKIVKPAFSFFDLLRIEHQRKAGVAGFRQCAHWRGRWRYREIAFRKGSSRRCPALILAFRRS